MDFILAFGRDGTRWLVKMPAMTLFEARGLTIVAGTRVLLREVSFTLAPGELVALRGPSGCGKTSLLRALCALDDCAAGEVLLEGRALVRPRNPFERGTRNSERGKVRATTFPRSASEVGTHLENEKTKEESF